MKFRKLKRSVKIRILKILGKNRGYFNIAGTKMFLDYLDPIDRELIETQKYEAKEINFLKKLYLKNSYEFFLDIGANCGFYSLSLAKEFSKLKVFAFEPNKEAFLKFTNSLKANLNLAERITLYNFGLSNSSGQLEMTSLEKFGYLQSGGSKIIDSNERVGIKSKIFTCDFIKGDEVLKINKKRICIKIDVEGHEYYVIDGLKNLLQNNKTIIQIEIMKKNFEKVDNLLKQIGFIFFYKTDGRDEWLANFYYKNFNLNNYDKKFS